MYIYDMHVNYIHMCWGVCVCVVVAPIMRWCVCVGVCVLECAYWILKNGRRAWVGLDFERGVFESAMDCAVMTASHSFFHNTPHRSIAASGQG